MTMGSIMAQATPCGVSYSALRPWAMECTMPRPTFEKPMPAIYWPRAMPSRPSGSSFTAVRRLAEMSRMASRWNMSEMAQAPFVM